MATTSVNSTIDNPWLQLTSKSPFVLEIDREQVEAYNAKLSKGDSRYVRLDLIPEPFVGNPKAPVVLLGLNPGYDDSDDEFYRQNEAACRLNLAHAPQQYPFYLLNPDYDRSQYTAVWMKNLIGDS